MSGDAQPASKGSLDMRDIRFYVQGLALLQGLVLVGLVVVLLQINGLPDQTAARVPFPIDQSGSVLYELGPIGTNVQDLQSQVAAMNVKLDEICAVVAKTVGTPPGLCTTP
jgi:hypothetical protein